jgi:hypothetical protein
MCAGCQCGGSSWAAYSGSIGTGLHGSPVRHRSRTPLAKGVAGVARVGRLILAGVAGLFRDEAPGPVVVTILDDTPPPAPRRARPQLPAAPLAIEARPWWEEAPQAETVTHGHRP